MSSSSSKKILDDVLNEVKALKKIQQENLIKQDAIEEMCHLMLRLLNDLSAKKDIELCSLNIKLPSAKPQKSKLDTSNVDKKKMNIMAYFKYMYTKDPATLYHIINAEEMNSVLNKHESELSSKKKGNIELAKATILYKDLISGNKSKQNLLRSMKEQEVEAEATFQSEINECEYVEEADEYLIEQASNYRKDSLEKLDEDSDHLEDLDD